MRSTIAVDVAAPVDVVFRLARRVDRWDRLLPHYVRSRVIARNADGASVCEFIAVRPVLPVLGLGLPVAWRARTWSEPADAAGVARLRFQHLGGATAGMDVTWRITPRPGGCRIEIEHRFARQLPVLGDRLFAQVVDRFFTRPIASRTLATFAALAEATAGAESEPAAEANPAA